MRSLASHPLVSVRLVLALLTASAVHLIVCGDASALPEEPRSSTTKSAPAEKALSETAPAETKVEAPANLPGQVPTEDAGSTLAEDSIDDEVPPRLDNKQTITLAAKWKRLGRNQIWINHQDKQVMVRGRICLQEGPLEMFACPGTTKAHESVIAAEAQASEIHACLEALGFPPGKPCQWDPRYAPAEGPLVKILVRWQDGDNSVQVDAREMIKASGTGKPLEKDWVFGGSQIYHDNVSGENIYYADSGEMVCLSNFSTAMLDVQLESSDAADGLLFEANKDKIPPPNTKVYMIFVPRKPDSPQPSNTLPANGDAPSGQPPKK